jgi:hypothetical protein
MAIKLTLENDNSEINQPVITIVAKFDDETRWHSIAETFFSGLYTLGFRFSPQDAAQDVFEILSEQQGQDIATNEEAIYGLVDEHDTCYEIPKWPF